MVIGERPATKFVASIEVPAAPASLVVASADAQGRQIVSVHVKRTYRLLPNGACKRAELAAPLLFGRESGENGDLGVPESDVIPFKQSTDLIVMAAAHAAAGATSSQVRVRVRDVERIYQVWGPRRCIYRGAGSWTFSSPERFEMVPLTYAYAYGGVDPSFPVPENVPIEAAFRLPPHAYPRNTVGRGYVIVENKEHVDGLLLPQLEHPQDLLIPSRLVTRDTRYWWRQPVPWSLDWFDGCWYPRSSFFGTLPEGLPLDDSAMFEVRSGWVQPGQVARLRALSADDRLDLRFADAASPALILPFLEGNETIRLGGVLPGGRDIAIQLPGEIPRIQLRHAGHEHDLQPRVHRVLISTLELGVYIVWHAAFFPPRPLIARRRSGRRGVAPELDGIEVIADGERIPNYDNLEDAVIAAE